MRAIDGARTRGLDLGKVARYQLRHYRIQYILTTEQQGSLIRRAIDGARTRGLDLGKVARYQLRHYRMFLAAGSLPATRDILQEL